MLTGRATFTVAEASELAGLVTDGPADAGPVLLVILFPLDIVEARDVERGGVRVARLSATLTGIEAPLGEVVRRRA